MFQMHNATYLTDIHTEKNQTSWQSVTMNENVHMTLVNLTVNLSECWKTLMLKIMINYSRQGLRHHLREIKVRVPETGIIRDLQEVPQRAVERGRGSWRRLDTMAVLLGQLQRHLRWVLNLSSSVIASGSDGQVYNLFSYFRCSRVHVHHPAHRRLRGDELPQAGRGPRPLHLRVLRHLAPHRR